MSEETNNTQPTSNPEVKPVLPEAPAVKPVLPEAPAAKPVLPEAPAAKTVLPEAPAAKPAAAASAPKIVLPTAAPKQPAKPSVSLPKANMSRPKPVSVKPLQPVAIKSDSPSVLSVAVDFIAAAVAVAFAVMIVLDV